MSVSFLKMKTSQILTKPGFYVLVLALVLSQTWDSTQSLFWGSILYCLILLNRRTDIKISTMEQTMFDPNTPEIIDNIIAQCFNEYIVLNVGFREKQYIREDDEKEIIMNLIDIVITRMSRTLLLRIKAYYNEELTEKVLSDKIYMLVMNYAIQNNMIESTPISELDSIRRKKENTMVNIL